MVDFDVGHIALGECVVIHISRNSGIGEVVGLITGLGLVLR
jgi:ABC-type glucose/galactose transport system permease subunit